MRYGYHLKIISWYYDITGIPPTSSNKMKYFSYSGGCGVGGYRCTKALLAWDIEKWLWFISNIVLYKTFITPKN